MAAALEEILGRLLLADNVAIKEVQTYNFGKQLLTVAIYNYQ